MLNDRLVIHLTVEEIQKVVIADDVKVESLFN